MKPNLVFKSQVALVVTFIRSDAEEIQDGFVRATCEGIERIAGLEEGMGYCTNGWRGHCEVAWEL